MHNFTIKDFVEIELGYLSERLFTKSPDNQLSWDQFQSKLKEFAQFVEKVPVDNKENRVETYVGFIGNGIDDLNTKVANDHDVNLAKKYINIFDKICKKNYISIPDVYSTNSYLRQRAIGKEPIAIDNLPKDYWHKEKWEEHCLTWLSFYINLYKSLYHF